MEQKKIYSNIGLSYFLLAAITLILQLAVGLIIRGTGNRISGNHILMWILSIAPMYLVGMPVCVRMLGRLPKKYLYRNRIKAGKWFLYFAICMFIMYAGNLVGNAVEAIISAITGIDMQFQLQEMISQEPLGIIFLFSVILAPILEELVFWKALIDRAIVLGDKAVILLSGFLFGLFHGNFYQLFYAFGIGCVFAYIYIRTGNVKYTISLHMAVNFFGGFLSAIFVKRLDIDMLTNSSVMPGQILAYLTGHIGILVLYLLYLLCMIALAITGLVLFIVNMKKAVYRSGEYSLPRRQMAKAMFGNVGMLLFCAICVVMFAVNMIP